MNRAGFGPWGESLVEVVPWSLHRAVVSLLEAEIRAAGVVLAGRLTDRWGRPALCWTCCAPTSGGRVPRFLFSTKGTHYHHPDAEAVSRIVVGTPGAELQFNYRTRYTEPWKAQHHRLRRRFDYRTRYPADGATGLTLRR